MTLFRGPALCCTLLLTCATVLPQTASATPFSPVTYAWASSIGGSPVSGTATFSTVADGGGWDLVIRVTNTSTVQPPGSQNILDGLYFDIGPSPGALTMLSALATEGLLTLDSPVTPVQVDANICALLGGLDAPNALCSSTAVGGWEAAYQASGIGGGASATQLWGIGTTGQTGVFHGNDVQTFNYGIVPSAGVTPTNGFDTYPFVYHTATFMLSGLTTDQITISNVAGAHGTQPEGTPAGTIVTEGPETPEPGTWMMMMSGVGVALISRLRSARKA